MAAAGRFGFRLNMKNSNASATRQAIAASPSTRKIATVYRPWLGT
jgi:hypothetical protein